MQIKVFKATSMREAVAQMKQELGENAVILHTKKYKDGGFLGVGSREMIELTAAIEDEKPAKKELTTEKIDPPPQQQSEPPQPTKVRPPSVLSQYKTSGTPEAIALAEKTQAVRAAVESLRTETPSTIDEPSEPPAPSFSDVLNATEPEVESESPSEEPEPVPVPDYEPEPQVIDEPPPLHTSSELLTAAMNIASTAEPAPQPEPLPQAIPLPTELSNLTASEPRPSMPPPTRSEQLTSSPPLVQSINASVGQPIGQSIGQSINQPIAPSLNQSINPTVSQPVGQAINPSPNVVTLTTEQLAQMQAAAVAQAMAQMQMSTPPPSSEPPKVETPPTPVEPKEERKDDREAERAESERQSEEKIKRLETEIAQMKAMLAKVLGRDVSRGTISLHEALRQQEVSEEILNDMAVSAGAGETLADSQSLEAKTTLMKYLQANLVFTDGIKLNRHGVRIAALLGTTGVGKTTTLAKIAAKFVLENQVTAALITADTYRISAVEQLRTYSDILGLPLEIVYTPAELSKAIMKHRSKDLILIDTAGRSQHNDYQMKELQELLAINQRIEKHLVLSTTTKQSDAKTIIEKFSVCEPDKIIFTKTDETSSIGLILNLLVKQQKLGLSYLTNGQSVPDDIIAATADNLATLLLRA